MPALRPTPPPARIQRQRAKGWRMPADTIDVTRPGVFGNPCTIKSIMDYYGEDRAQAQRLAVEWFSDWLAGKLPDAEDIEARRDRLMKRLPELRGKNLACWCKPGVPCHADVLLELANRQESA